MKLFMAFRRHLLQHDEIDSRSRELLILRIGWTCGAEYEFTHHKVTGYEAGVSDDEIQRVTAIDNRDWSPRDLTLLDMADELCSQITVSDTSGTSLAETDSESARHQRTLLGNVLGTHRASR